MLFGLVCTPRKRASLLCATALQRCGAHTLTLCVSHCVCCRHLGLNPQGAAQGFDALREIPGNAAERFSLGAERLYSIVNWDEEGEPGETIAARRARRRAAALRRRAGRGGGIGGDAGGQTGQNMGLRARVAQAATQVSKVAGRLADVLGAPAGGARKKGLPQGRASGQQGSTAAEAASAGED